MPATTIEQVTQLVRQAVENATGWVTVIAPVQGPEPANQYCVVTDQRAYKQPHDVINYTQTETNITEHQRSETTITYEIMARGFGAMDAIDKFTSYLDSELRDVDLWPYVGSGGHDDAQQMNTYHMGKMLEIAVVNIDIHTSLKKQNSLEWMNSVDIDVFKENNKIATITVPDVEPEEEGN